MQVIYNYIPETKVFLRHILLELLCIYKHCYIYCYAAREICLVLLICTYCWYVTQVLSDWFWEGSSCPYYFKYHFCFRIPHALNFYYKVFKFYKILSYFLNRITVS